MYDGGDGLNTKDDRGWDIFLGSSHELLIERTICHHEVGHRHPSL